MEGGLGPGIVATIVGIGLVLLCSLIWAIVRMCKKDEPDHGAGYSVAVSNRLFKDASTDGKDGLPCLNCRLIEMGEMACYQEQCPQCGRIPPGKKQNYDISFSGHLGVRDQMPFTCKDSHQGQSQRDHSTRDSYV